MLLIDNCHTIENRSLSMFQSVDLDAFFQSAKVYETSNLTWCWAVVYPMAVKRKKNKQLIVR